MKASLKLNTPLCWCPFEVRSQRQVRDGWASGFSKTGAAGYHRLL